MTGYCISAINIAISRITQKNLMKHPMHPVMPSSKSPLRNPKSCIPQPRMPRSTNAPISIKYDNHLLFGYFILRHKKGTNQFHSVLKVLDYLYKNNENQLTPMGIC